MTLYYDFYFNGAFVQRFDSYNKAKKLVTWNENLTHPKNLYEIKTVNVQQEVKKEKKTWKNKCLNKTKKNTKNG